MPNTKERIEFSSPAGTIENSTQVVESILFLFQPISIPLLRTTKRMGPFTLCDLQQRIAFGYNGLYRNW